MRDFVAKQPLPQKQAQEKPKPSFYKISLGVSTLLATLFSLGALILIPLQLTKPLNSIKIEGNFILTADEVASQIYIKEDTSWYQLDSYELSKQVQNQVWIKEARVKKLPGGELWIKVTEQQPIAFFRTANGLFLLSQDFTLLPIKKNPRGWDLPTILDSKTKLKAGEKAKGFTLQKSFELLKKLKGNKLLSIGSISEVDISDPLNLTLTTLPLGIKIKMGYRDFDEKLDRLKRALPEISKRAKKIYSLDLRNHQGIALKYK